jgi:hypothetical protein
MTWQEWEGNKGFIEMKLASDSCFKEFILFMPMALSYMEVNNLHA